MPALFLVVTQHKKTGRFRGEAYTSPTAPAPTMATKWFDKKSEAEAQFWRMLIKRFPDQAKEVLARREYPD